MAINDRRALFDGDASFILGQDQGRKPNELSAGQYVRGRNVSARGGRLASRPPLRHLPLTFADNSTRDLFLKGTFQGAVVYADQLVCMVHGRLMSIRISTWELTDLSDLVGLNNSRIDRCTFAMPGPYLVIQNGIDRAIIGEGTAWRRATTVPNPSALPGDPRVTAQEVPTGTVMAYGYGRLFVGRGNRWTAGDIIKIDTPADVLRWSENLYLDEGGSFALPTWMGAITAMAFNQTLDSSLGIGGLLVFGENGIMAYNVAEDRSDWMGVVVHIGPGAVGPMSVVNVNSDVWFRSSDGIRSWRLAANEHQGWANTPESSELSADLALDTGWLLPNVSMVHFDNRVLVSWKTRQRRTSGDPANGYVQRFYDGLISLDFDRSSTILTKASPAYDGTWDGVSPLQILTGWAHQVERCFVFSCDDLNMTRLYELGRTGQYDEYQGKPVRIRSYVETRAYSSQSPFSLKRLASGDIWMIDVAGTVDLSVHYRAEKDPSWIPWRTVQLNQTVDTPSSQTTELPNLRPAPRARLMLGSPDTMDCEPNYNHYAVQLALQWYGSVLVDRLRIHIDYLDESTNAPCETIETSIERLGEPILAGYAIAPALEDD